MTLASLLKCIGILLCLKLLNSTRHWADLGITIYFQENALETFNPVWIGTLRAIFGVITLFIICRVMRISGDSKQWRLYTVIGLLEATIPFILIPFAQKS